jgi:hypothetical protein
VTQPTPNGSTPAVKPAFDPVNPYQGVLPLEWTTDVLNIPQGQFGAIGFRTPNSTTTIVLAKDDVAVLIKSLQELHGRMHGLIIA